MRTLSGLLLLALAAPVAATDVYRWVDKNGQVHFTQSPPAGIDSKLVAGPQPQATSNPEMEKIKQFNATAQKGDEQKAAADAKTAKDKAAAAGACATAQQRASTLESRPPNRVVMKDASGNLVRMTQDDYNKALAHARADISKNCK